MHKTHQVILLLDYLQNNVVFIIIPDALVVYYKLKFFGQKVP